MSAHWMAGQLIRLADGRTAMPLEVPRYNPRPAGVIREGSASHAILLYLSKKPATRFVSSAELISGTGRTHAAVSWALVYLRSLSLIDAVTDEARNPRYNLYRLAKGSN